MDKTTETQGENLLLTSLGQKTRMVTKMNHRRGAGDNRLRLRLEVPLTREPDLDNASVGSVRRVYQRINPQETRTCATSSLI